MKHTPGPWRMVRNPVDHPMPFQIIGQPNTETGHRGHVCNVFVHGDNRDSTERANTRMLVAAPEMFELLKSASNQLTSDGTAPTLVAIIDALITDVSKGDE